MAVSAVPTTDLTPILAEALQIDLMLLSHGPYLFDRMIHYRHSPHARLRGSRFARWIATRLGVYAGIEWTKDPDWEPPTLKWQEDAL